MKKILIEASAMAQPHKAGVGYFTEHLAKGLENFGHDQKAAHVEYLWLNFLNRKKPGTPLLQQAKKDGRLRELFHIPQRVYAKLVFIGIHIPLLWRTYDAVIFPNFYLWSVPRAKKKIVVIHDLCFKRFPEYIETKNLHFLRSVVGYSMKKADAVITVSEFSKREIMEFYNIPKDKILVVDIPINPERFSGATKDIGSLAKYGITKSYILFVSTLEPRKNLESLVKAYVALPESLRQKYSLVLAGGYGWKTEELKILIQNYRAQGMDIITTGYVDDADLGTLFACSEIFVIPSHYEGFGMPLMEALAAGKPTIANDIPVLHETAGDAAYYVDATDIAEFSAGLKLLLTDKPLRDSLAAKAPARIANASWEKTTKKVLEFIEKL